MVKEPGARQQAGARRFWPAALAAHLAAAPEARAEALGAVAALVGGGACADGGLLGGVRRVLARGLEAGGGALFCFALLLLW